MMFRLPFGGHSIPWICPKIGPKDCERKGWEDENCKRKGWENEDCEW